MAEFRILGMGESAPTGEVGSGCHDATDGQRGFRTLSDMVSDTSRLGFGGTVGMERS